MSTPHQHRRLRFNLQADELEELLSELPHAAAMDVLGGYGENSIAHFEDLKQTPNEDQLFSQALHEMIDNERESGNELGAYLSDAHLQMIRFVAEQAVEEIYSTLVGLLKRIDPDESAEKQLWDQARADYRDGMTGIRNSVRDATPQEAKK